MRSTLLAITASMALLLSGCGSSDSAFFDQITVTGKTTPKIKAKDVKVEKTAVKVLKKGNGDVIKKDSTVSIKYLVANARTGKEIDSSFAADTPQTISLASKTILPAFTKGLVNQKVGSRVLVAVSAADGASKLQDPSQLDLKKTDAMLFVFDIIAIIPSKLEGGTPQEAPANMPALQLKDGTPTGFKKTADTPKKLEKSAKHVLIEGDGEPLAKDATMTVLYLGATWPDGTNFNDAYPTGPVPGFKLGSMIPCWNDLLPGTKVGSRVVLECTAADAYGDKPKDDGSPTGPLIFAVDILSAS